VTGAAAISPWIDGLAASGGQPVFGLVRLLLPHQQGLPRQPPVFQVIPEGGGPWDSNPEPAD
jgi:hypothetical protein